VETLSNFLRFASPFDLLIIVLTLILVVAGIVLLVVLRSRKPFYLFFVLALLPLLLGMLSTYLKYREINRMLTMIAEAGVEVVGAARREAWIITYFGAAGTAVLALIGLLGVLLKKNGEG
jgi:hypothetical protein